MFDKRAYDDYVRNYEDSAYDERINCLNSDWQIDALDNDGADELAEQRYYDRLDLIQLQGEFYSGACREE